MLSNLTLFLVAMAARHAPAYFAPSVFVNHGGGPNPILGHEDDREIAESFRNLSKIIDLEKLRAIVVVTAHRSEDKVTISSGAKHDLLFDYYNFPPKAYTFKYDAPGAPELARRLHGAFEKAGIPSALDDQRGWDHGVFVPMMLINPKADIPIVQVSILRNQDTKQHLTIGEVLYSFREEGVAIFGSGMTYHNMREVLRAEMRNDRVVMNEKFDRFLNDACTGKVDAKEAMLNWDRVPQGLESHPVGKADHLMPLIVNIGAGGGRPARNFFSSLYMHKFLLSGFIWDEK